MDNVSPPLVAVITIVKDDLVGLDRTSRSVLAQENVQFKYLIVDGSLGSETRQLHEQLRRSNAQVLTGPDGGIYPAMARGLAHCDDGCMVLFMNAGDSFAESNSLATLVSAAVTAGSRWVYGRAAILRNGRPWRPPVGLVPYRLWLHALGRAAICHQAVLMDKSLIQEVGGFRASEGLQADVGLLLRAARKSRPISIPDIVAHYDAEGISSSHLRKACWNKHIIRVDVFKLKYPLRAVDAAYTYLQWGYLGVRRSLKIAIMACVATCRNRINL